MTSTTKALATGLAGLAIGITAGSALAAGTGQPEPWQIAMQEPVTATARRLYDFHTLLMWIITIITIFVAGLLAYCMVKFNEKANPVPSKTAHNTVIEIAWTVVPVLILVLISIPSFRLLREQLILPPADVVVKATGHSWYWEYSYPGDKEGKGAFTFDSRIVSDPSDQTKALPGKDGTPRLLAVDNEMVVPVNKVVRVQVTADIVSHAFAMPSFGLKIDAMPGRLNETWFKAERVGVYHGQCSELCGQFHAFMPITIRVVSEQDYATWLGEAQKKYASDEPAAGATRLADNSSSAK